MILIDTHCHLDFKEFDRDRDEVISRAKHSGVSYILNVGANLESSRSSIKLAKGFDNMFASVGLHPHEAHLLDKDAKKEFERLAKEEKVVAIGEVGLDFYRELSSREHQEAAFRYFIDLSRKTNLPLILHTREAFPEMIKILEEEIANGPLRGVFHCFSADIEVLKRVLQMGFYVSVGGPITYPKNDSLRSLVHEIPDRHLLIETDAPYLAPQSHRGKRNEPAYLFEIAEKFAEVRGVSVEDIARITTLNANNLFGIPGTKQEPSFVYRIRENLYLNVTNQCTNDCFFCDRLFDAIVKGHILKLDKEPTARDLIDGVFSEGKPVKEVVFCGYGEPLIRLEVIKEVAKALKEKGYRIRVNTNGQANLIHKRNILPELKGIVDSMSISLNAPDSEGYNKMCRPKFDGDVYQAIKDFVLEAKKYIPYVQVTALRMPDIDSDQVNKVAREELAVPIHWRDYNRVG